MTDAMRALEHRWHISLIGIPSWLPPQVGERRYANRGFHCWELQYQPDAVPWKGGLVSFGIDNKQLGKPLSDGWVLIYGDDVHYPYIGEDGRRVG